jgi:membrane protease YdiL (CAAX protease family)
MFLETLLVFIPALISSKIEKKPFKKLLSEMGFKKNEDILIKIIAGLSIGIFLFFFGNVLIIFFRDIVVENLLGTGFIEQGQEGLINTTPIQPDVFQLLILVILQIIIIGPCEEAFFRAFIIKKFQGKIKVVYGVLISSIFFTSYHVPPFLVPITTILTFFGYYFVIGVFLALIFIYFNYSLIPCSVAHSFFNILILLL